MVKLDEREIQNKIDKREYFVPSQMEKFFDKIGNKIKRIKTNKQITYLNIPCAFDIETTSLKQKVGKVEAKCSVMYEWTLGINWEIMVGRTWDEFLDVMQYATEYFELYKDVRLVIYVHNLSFEFQAFRKLFSWEKVFALKERKPIQCITTEGIEFRCSYLLSGYSLNSLGKNLTKYNVKKLTGELDYDLPRSPITPLTENEINYCLNDVYVVMAYIQETMDRMGNITKIPLTKTGYVRKYCRDSCLYVDKSHREGLEKYRYYRKI